MSTKTEANDLLTAEVARLGSLVEQQQQLLNDQRLRLAALEANGHGGSANDSPGNGNGRHSRRDLLRMAGLAAAGAAGAAGVTALQALPAAAATNGNFVLGKANDADASTILNPSGAAPAAANSPGLLDVDGSVTSGATPGLAVNATANFFRSVRGIAPLTQAAGPSGVGVWGSSDAGAGVVGSSTTGVDLWAFNSGRLMEAAQPAGAPTYQGGVYDATLATPAWTDFELIRDQNGIVWVFVPPSANGANIAPGTAPGGTWLPLQPGGIGAAGAQNSSGSVFTAVTTKLLMLTGSDGSTFQDMMPDNSPGIGLTGGPDLVLNVTPAFNCLALITGSADLYTDTSGVNQDIGIYVSPSGLPAANQNIVAWKESGGSAGTNSPNAAFVQAVFALARGTAYNIRMKWKANNAQPAGAHIRAGAGPFPRSAGLTSVSPTRLTAVLLINP